MKTVERTRMRPILRLGWVTCSLVFGCGDSEKEGHTDPNIIEDTAIQSEDSGFIEDTAHSDTDDSDTAAPQDPEEEDCEPVVYQPNPFITEVVEVEFGEGAGFGQDQFPDIVFGPPLGAGPNSGSLDVVTIGHEGFLTVAFDQKIVDGTGPDLIVFENVFIGWYETGIISASTDGETWYTWDCDPLDADNGFPGCAGTSPSLSHPDNCINAQDPELAGGDAFDLADIGLSEALYIRIADSGANTSGGFDLDAVSIINGAPK